MRIKSIAAFSAALLLAIPFVACENDGNAEDQQQPSPEDKDNTGNQDDIGNGSQESDDPIKYDGPVKPITCGEAKDPELQTIEDTIIKYCDDHISTILSCMEPRSLISLYANTGICQKELTALLANHYDVLRDEKQLDKSLSDAFDSCADKAIAQCIKDNKLGNRHEWVVNYTQTSLKCLRPNLTGEKFDQSVNSSITTTYLRMV